MAADRIIGIDFGTSTSVIRVKRYQNGKPIGEKLDTKEVIFGGMSNVVPTFIMKSKTNSDAVYYGHEALNRRRNMEQFHSFKVDLESRDSAKREQARALTEEFFCFMAKKYQEQSNSGHLGDADDREHTIISYPVKWSKETKQFMLEAAEKAGFPDVRGLDEAQAAIHAVTVQNTNYLVNRQLLAKGVPANILLIDMGAGTTDLVLCRYTFNDKPKNEILSTWPKDGSILFGGKEIDVLLKDFFRDKMDGDDARLVFKRVGSDKFKAWKETTVSPALMRNDTVSEFEALDQCVDLAQINMDDYCLDRAALEKCLAGYLTQLPRLIEGCLKDANCTGSEVDLIIVTGGHSQWYFVQEMLAGRMDRFGKVDLPKVKADPSRIVPVSRPQETVALGLAYAFMQAEIGPVEIPTPVDLPASPKPEPPKPVPPKPIPPKPPEGLEYTPDSEFKLLADGEDYVIAKYLGDRAEVVIPSMIRGRKVTAICDCAFFRSEQIRVPSTSWFRDTELKTIYTCPVEKVILPDTIKKIGNCAFNNAEKLKTVIAPAVTMIDAYAFSGCVKLDSFIANPCVQSIGDHAFRECNNLRIMDFGIGEAVSGFIRFPKELKVLGSGSIASLNLIKEIMISKKTRWKHRDGDAFSTDQIAVFYYND